MDNDEEMVTSRDVNKKVKASHTNPSEGTAALVLGATSSYLTDEQLILNNPYLKKLLNRMLDEQIHDAKDKGESSSSGLLTRMSLQVEEPKITRQTKRRKNNPGIVVKSPLDTTIYMYQL